MQLGTFPKLGAGASPKDGPNSKSHPLSLSHASWVPKTASLSSWILHCLFQHPRETHGAYGLEIGLEKNSALRHISEASNTSSSYSN